MSSSKTLEVMRESDCFDDGSDKFAWPLNFQCFISKGTYMI